MTLNRALLALVLGFSCVAASAVAKVANPVLFKVEPFLGGPTSFLLGTFHNGVGLDEFPPYLLRALDASEVYVAEEKMIEIASLFELLRTDPDAAVARLKVIFEQQDNKGDLTPKEVDQLIQLGIPRAFALEMHTGDCFQITHHKILFQEPFHSLEAELESRAVAGGKEVVALNTKAIRQADRKRKKTAKKCSVREWLKDPVEIARQESISARSRAEYRSLSPQEILDESDDDYAPSLSFRTSAWMPELKRLLKNRSAFVAVGLAHLPGKNGLIRLLQDAGFYVVPYINKPK